MEKKDLQKAWRTTDQGHFQITRNSESLEAKYQEMKGHLKQFHSNVSLCNSKCNKSNPFFRETNPTAQKVESHYRRMMRWYDASIAAAKTDMFNITYRVSITPLCTKILAHQFNADNQAY